jgi:hypothetical protein
MCLIINRDSSGPRKRTADPGVELGFLIVYLCQWGRGKFSVILAGLEFGSFSASCSHSLCLRLGYSLRLIVGFSSFSGGTDPLPFGVGTIGRRKIGSENDSLGAFNS